MLFRSAAFETRPAERITRHICTNLIMTARSEMQVSGHLYALLYTGDRGDEHTGIIVANDKQLIGEFEDDYVRTEHGWRIAKRVGKLILSTK